ncbi:MAG: type III-A CRISPR-associated protein Cas10/Csm1, partial [Magnetococcales bacterium]|nr:type III-A CRISPR-associated protein Cas10/Csm1 [Magnetococcales bacterium]
TCRYRVTVPPGQRLQQVRKELDQWFLANTFGQSGIGLATTSAKRADFRKKQFGGLIQRLFNDLNRRKRQQFHLCGVDAPPPVFADVLYSEDKGGVCDYCGKAPADRRDYNGIPCCCLCRDQITLGQQLVKSDALLISRTAVDGDDDQTPLQLDYLGYRVHFAKLGKQVSRLDLLAERGQLLRLWDFALPQSGDQPLWRGYARRAINSYVPEGDDGEIIDFAALAEKGVQPCSDGDGRCGVAALGILKGDVDNLGLLFERGMQQPTFARMAALSRQLNAFFAIWLPYHCQRNAVNTYTVFAGGDDFFLIGPWLSQIRLVQAMRESFGRYVVNGAIHFSAGLATTKSNVPVPALADMAEQALEQAKGVAGKNAITCWQRPVSWPLFDEMMQAGEQLENMVVELQQQHDITVSTGYLYGLLQLCDKAERARDHPQDAIWNSWFVYRTWRFIVDRLRDGDDIEQKRKKLFQEISVAIGDTIRKNQGDYKIALFTYLYQRRSAE